MGRGTATLAALELLDPKARPTTVGELWKERPAVIAFTRHFG
jgi:hypothetical protein